MSSLLDDPVGLIIGAAALVVALGVLGKAGRGAFRWLRTVGRNLNAIETVVQRELDHNHGSSMKDDVAGIAIAVGKLGRDLDDLKRAQLADRAELRAHLTARATARAAAEEVARHKRESDQ